MTYVHTAARTNQTEFTSSPRMIATIVQDTPPRRPMTR